MNARLLRTFLLCLVGIGCSAVLTQGVTFAQGADEPKDSPPPPVASLDTSGTAVTTPAEKVDPSRANLPLAKQLVASGWKASWSPDGSRLVYGKPAGKGLQILEIETGKVKDLTDSGKDAAWSPDGRFIAYVKEPKFNNYQQEEVWLVSPTGELDRKLVDGGFPGWSADSKRVVFHSRKENKMFAVGVVDPDAVPTLFFERPLSWYPAVSLDGERIAFGMRGKLVVVERETGKTVLEWPAPGAGGLLPAWSADGKKIALGSFSSGLGMWVIDVESQQAVQVAKGRYTMPTWSRDGSKLAFDLRMPTGNQVWLVDVKELEKLKPSRPPIVASSGRNVIAAKNEPRESRGFSIGTEAPEIEGEDIDAVPFKLSDYRGKVVVLDFWGDW